MKIARLRIPEGTVYASLREDGYHIILGDIFAEWGELSEPYEGEYTLLSPVSPSKVVCLGANYKKHAEELSLDVLPDPTIFLKPPSSVIASGEDILYPATATKVDYESELAVVIGKRARNVKEADALSYVLGYTAANDVTERNMQKKDGQWTRAKSFDTFCPLGAYIETDLDPSDLEIIGRRNGVVVQCGRTRDLINSVEKSIAFISGVMTLEPGDVILTGTPVGIGELSIGDTFEVEIKGVTTLTNRVVKEVL
ncbi:MAG: fumarylacetoacetate hydrolase family protein [Clostridia bacterium]|nr:fumarylacetoacetate hydrolase family protein [Clostridia bacterium]